jgi:hypothetical protein
MDAASAISGWDFPLYCKVPGLKDALVAMIIMRKPQPPEQDTDTFDGPSTPRSAVQHTANLNAHSDNIRMCIWPFFMSFLTLIY